MALCCCSNGLLMTTAVALLFIPLQYYIPGFVPDASLSSESPSLPPVEEASSVQWLDNAVAQFPPLDVLATMSVLLIGLTFYIFDWIQRKVLERRLAKLNNSLATSVERLRTWDVHQEELENILKMVQNATSEYNLLLFLLLREKHFVGELGPRSETIFEKNFPDDIGLTLQNLNV